MIGLIVIGTAIAALGRRKDTVGRVPPFGVKGDLDYDGMITQNDVDLLQKWIKGKGALTADQVIRGDVNCDGFTDEDDLVELKAYLNWETAGFPVGGNKWVV